MRTLSMAVVGLVAFVVEALAQSGGRPAIEHLAFEVEGHGEMTYGISLPAGDDSNGPRPLILVLHPGGSSGAYYGSMNMQRIFEPALRGLGAIIVAPDAPTGRWTSEISDRAVIALLEAVAKTYAVDRTRVLVTGFSLGGRGTWFFATGHSELFTGAISIAGSPANDPLDALGEMPIAIIHSRADEVVPFGPAEAAAQALEAAKHPVRFTVLEGVGHFAMGGYVSALRDAGDWIVEQWDGRKLGSAD